MGKEGARAGIPLALSLTAPYLRLTYLLTTADLHKR